jgi:hypothetical protein
VQRCALRIPAAEADRLPVDSKGPAFEVAPSAPLTKGEPRTDVSTKGVRQTGVMVHLGRDGGQGTRVRRQVWAEWMAANDANDPERAGQLAEEMTGIVADSFFAWFEAGLYSKARRNWRECADRNGRALALFGNAEAEEFGGANPAAWSLGLAATAMGAAP